MVRWTRLLIWGATAALLMACTGARGGVSSATVPLYVVNAGDGTVSRLDGQSGRSLGPALSAHRAPGQIAAGRGGGLLVGGASGEYGGELTFLAPAAAGGGREDQWRTRPLALGEPAEGVTLAGDGYDHAVVTYYPVAGEAGRPRCRLSLVDLRDGTAARPHTVCAADEQVGGLALASGPAGPIAYVALWRGVTSASGVWAIVRPRVVDLDAATGAVAAMQLLSGVPVHLSLGAAPGRLGTRLYCIEADPDERYDAGAWGRRLLGLNPETLEVETDLKVARPISRLVVAPDGDRAYGLTDAGASLVEIDLLTGATARRIELPRTGHALDIAVTERWVYIANAFGNEIWTVDRVRGGIVRTIRVGQGPVALAHPEPRIIG
jgi:DNA-binding beta-propeller fold protein YncE